MSSSRRIAAVVAVAQLAAGSAWAAGAAESRAQAVEAEPTMRELAAPESDKLRYALWELVPLGLDEGTADAMLDMLRGELAKIVGDRLVVSARAVEKDIRRAVDECTDRVACLADAAGAFGAQRAVFGAVTNLGDTYNMNLKLLDIGRREVVARETATLSGSRNQLLKQIQILLFKLIAPSQLLGHLALTIDVGGADVYIDGQKVGTTPLPQKLAPLPEGEHSLKVSAPQIEDYFTFFTVHYGKTTEITVDATHLKAVQASLAVTHRPLKPIILGAKVGYSSNLGKLTSPTVAIEIGGCLWALSEYLFVGMDVSYLRHESRAATTLGERVTTSLWSAPMVGWVGAEVPIGAWALLGRAGGGAALVGRSIKSSSSGHTGTRDVEPAFYGALGGSLKLGPGALLAETSYLHTLANDLAVSGSAGGLRGLLGYRLEI